MFKWCFERVRIPLQRPLTRGGTVFKTLIGTAVIVGASVTAASQAETPREAQAPIAARAAPCATLTGAGAQLTDADLSEFLRISKWVASAPAAAALCNVTVTRVGTTVFHVRPGTSVPTQPVPHYPYFIVDTAAPTRVAYWGQSGG